MKDGETTEVFYIASARCREVKNADGSVRTKENAEVWLGMSDGYPSGGSKAHAHKFATPEEIRRSWTEWDGMPWWYRLKPDSLKILRVTEYRAYSRREEAHP